MVARESGSESGESQQPTMLSGADHQHCRSVLHGGLVFVHPYVELILVALGPIHLSGRHVHQNTPSVSVMDHQLTTDQSNQGGHSVPDPHLGEMEEIWDQLVSMRVKPFKVSLRNQPFCKEKVGTAIR